MTDALAVAETHPARQELMAKQLVGLLRPGVVVTFTALLGRQNRDDLNGASGVVLGAFKDGGFPVLVLRENSMGRPEQLRLRLENILPAPQEHPARAIESVANVFDTAELMSDVAAQLPVAHLCRFAAVCVQERGRASRPLCRSTFGDSRSLCVPTSAFGPGKRVRRRTMATWSEASRWRCKTCPEIKRS